MKSNKLIKAVAAVVACGLFVSAGFFASKAVESADKINGRVPLVNPSGTDNVYVQTNSDSISLEINNNAVSGENFFGEYNYNSTIGNNDLVAPGFTREGTVTISLKSGSTANAKVYLYAKPTGDRNEQANFSSKNVGFKDNSKNILDNANLTIKAANGDEIYSGKLNGEATVDPNYTDPHPEYVDEPTTTSSTTASTEPSSDSGTPPASGGSMIDVKGIYLGKLAPGESVKFTFKLELPATLGNDYSNTFAMIDWVFLATMDEPTQPPSSTTEPTTAPTTEPTTTTTAAPTTAPPPAPDVPKTGEESIPYTVAAIACALSGFGIFTAAFGRREKQTEE